MIMYGCILAAVNEHVASEVSARYAIALARAIGARVLLCHVVEPGASAASVERSKEAMGKLFVHAKDSGLHVESITETGEPVDTIRRIVKASDVEIVFASLRRGEARKRMGAVTHGLLRALSCTVALVNVIHLGRIHPHDILIPLKAGISHMKERAQFAAMMSKAFGSKLCLLHASKPIASFFHGELHLKPVELEARLPKDYGEFLAHLDRFGVSHEKCLIAGRAGHHIATEASRMRSDLIIMGASERGFIPTLLGENTVSHVLQHAQCNVILLRPSRERK